MSAGHRQAAVALYGLAASDQESILKELPEADQQILKEYLAELAALGFDKTAGLDDAVAMPSAPAALPAPAAVAAPAERLRAAPAAVVMAILAHEPASLIAQVLALQTWPWAQELLDMLPPQRRKLVREALDAGSAAAPARARFLVDALAAALPPVPTSLPARRRPTRSNRWLPWTR